MEEKNEHIELRSDEVQEILSHMPHWLIRWGITLILLIVIAVVAGSWFVKYPEIIVSQARVVTEVPPIRLVAKSSGKIKLFTQDKAPVSSGQYLGVIENPANTEDVEKLRGYLTNLRDSINTTDPLEFENLQLGELQADFSVLLQAYNEYAFFIGHNYYQSKMGKIQTQKEYYRSLNEKLAGQKEILKRELDLAETKYKNDQELYKTGVISMLDLSRSESEYLQKKYAWRNAEISQVNNNIQVEEYSKTNIDLRQQNEERRQSLTINLQEAVKRMNSALARWEQQYVIKAPIDGEVSFFKFYSNNQYVATGEEILTVLPRSEKLIAQVFVPLFGSGKIREGQKVNIKLESYPFKEFGIVEGRVESISRMSRDNMYLIYVSLPKGLKTSYGKNLEFKQEMLGTAEIITEDLRLFERIFNQLRSLVKNTA